MLLCRLAMHPFSDCNFSYSAMVVWLLKIHLYQQLKHSISENYLSYTYWTQNYTLLINYHCIIFPKAPKFL